VDISITGATKNRKFGKACVRLRWILEGLRGCCDDIDTTSEPFDILQLVFMDRPESYLVVRGTRGGERLFQIEVGMGLDRLFASEEDHRFLRMMAEQVLRAVSKSSLRTATRENVTARVERWIDSLGERFDETNLA